MDKRKLNNETGITIIALSITIIVMLILAGISIATVSPMIKNSEEAKQEQDIETEKSIVSRAAFAAEKVGVKGEITQANLQKMMQNELPSGNFTVTENGDGFTITFTDSNRSYNVDATGSKEEEVDGVPIPKDFVYVGGTKASGLVISDETADRNKYKGQTTVGTDLVGNQFVWIPVDDIADYKRTAYSTEVATGTIDSTTNSEQIEYNSSSGIDYFTEALPADEKTSVEKNKGYYIGRYEAGDKESTEAKNLRKGSSTSNTITVKAGQAPYNFVTRTQSEILAEGFSAKQGYTSVTSKLVSSYAWDTAIAFLQKTNSDYGSSSEEGNYCDTTSTYTDITGAANQIKEKVQYNGTLIPTGQTIAVNNIYDMGGNVWEWTTETSSSWNKIFYTMRGGGHVSNFASCPAGGRTRNVNTAYGSDGFRITLFL